MAGKYDDIIHLQRPISGRHAPMSIHDRAAQFSPFAALVGHEEALAETGRLTEARVELDESRKAAIDWVLQQAAARIEERPMVTATYFEPDARKAGGAYRTVTGRLQRLDPYTEQLLLTDGTVIPVQELTEFQLLK